MTEGAHNILRIEKKGQIIQHVKMWLKVSEKLSQGRLHIVHDQAFSIQLIMVRMMFMIQGLFFVHLCIHFLKFVPGYIVPSPQEKKHALRLCFFTSVQFMGNVQIYTRLQAHAHIDLHTAPLPGWGSRLLQLLQLTPAHTGPQSMSLYFLPVFFQEQSSMFTLDMATWLCE